MGQVHLPFQQCNLHRNRKVNSNIIQPACGGRECLIRAPPVQSLPGGSARLPGSEICLHRHYSIPLPGPSQIHEIGVDWYGDCLSGFNAHHPSVDALHPQAKHAIPDEEQDHKFCHPKVGGCLGSQSLFP